MDKDFTPEIVFRVWNKEIKKYESSHSQGGANCKSSWNSKELANRFATKWFNWRQQRSPQYSSRDELFEIHKCHIVYQETL